jgi:integrase
VERRTLASRRADLHPLFSAHVQRLDRQNRNLKTVARSVYALDHLQEWLQTLDVDPRDVTEDLLEEYVGYLTTVRENSSVRTETDKVKAAYRYAERIGLIEKNPAQYVETPALEDKEVETYTNDELRRIRAVIMDDLDDVLFHAYAFTGLRRFELVSTERAAVDLPNAVMTVRGKGGKLRRVPIHPSFAEALVAYCRAHPDEETVVGRSTRNVNLRLEKLLDRAKVQRSNRPVHKFRATVQSSLYDEGVREDVIDAILGWGARSVRQRHYSRVRDETKFEGILRLYASDPIDAPSLRVVPEIDTRGRRSA